MTTKRALELENRRLRDEVGFLRGQIDVLQKANMGTVDSMERIVKAFMPEVQPLSVETKEVPETGDPAEFEDWTDGLLEVHTPWPVGDPEGFMIGDE